MDHPQETPTKQAQMGALVAAGQNWARVAELVGRARDREHAADLLADALGLPTTLGHTVLDQQLATFTRAPLGRLADDLAVESADWGPPLTAHARFQSPTSAVVTLEGVEHSVTGADEEDTVEQLRLLVAGAARRALRPVTVHTGLIGSAPVRLEVAPNGNTRFSYADDEQSDVELTAAVPTTSIDDDGVRVTTWTFPGPGASTGAHVHEHDYVVVPVTGGTFTVRATDGSTREMTQHAGRPYRGSAGTAHEVICSSADPTVFVELELPAAPGATI